MIVGTYIKAKYVPEGIDCYRGLRLVCLDVDSDWSETELLGHIFHYGQNDFQPRAGKPSLSVGDVIRIDSGDFEILPVGFKKL